MSFSSPASGFVVKSQQPNTQLAFRLQGTLGEPGSPPDLQDAIEVALAWVQNKHYEHLPQLALQGKSFQVGEEGRKAMGVRHHNEWAVRFVQPDAGYKDTRPVPGRTWISDIWLCRAADALHFACRALCTTSADRKEPVPYMRPKLVLDLDEAFGLYLGGVRATGDRALRSQQDFKDLERFLKNRARNLPIVVVSEFDEHQWSGFGGSFVEMIEVYARRLRCLAHLYAQPSAAIELSQTYLPHPWGVFRGGVRLYMPGFDMDAQNPDQHPLYIGATVASYHLMNLEGPEALAKKLQERCVEFVTQRPLDEPNPRFYNELSAAALRDIELESGAGEAAAKILNLQQMLELQTDQRKELDSRVDALERENSRLGSSNDELRSENERLKKHNAELTSQLGVLRAKLASTDRTSSYTQLIRWCSENLSDRLVLLPRAQRELSGASYEDIALVAQSLDFLAAEARDFLLSREGAKEKFEERLNRVGVKMDKTGSPSMLGQFEQQYRVTYPVGSQSSRFLEWHLKKGTSRDPKECMRIYFFLDEESSKIIVGSLPRHLQTPST